MSILYIIKILNLEKNFKSLLKMIVKKGKGNFQSWLKKYKKQVTNFTKKPSVCKERQVFGMQCHGFCTIFVSEICSGVARSYTEQEDTMEQKGRTRWARPKLAEGIPSCSQDWVFTHSFTKFSNLDKNYSLVHHIFVIEK